MGNHRNERIVAEMRGRITQQQSGETKPAIFDLAQGATADSMECPSSSVTAPGN